MQWYKYTGITIFMSILYCEFLADYIQLWYCHWPTLPFKNNDPTLRAMILADTHLIGPIKGHWLDQLYREWHMSGAFQAAVRLHEPDVAFILGDLFDEGDLVNSEYFREYVKRFRKYFYVSNRTSIITAAGNHDIGFHYKMGVSNLMKRFKDHFQNTGVQLYSIKNIHFVIINSMAMENDGCSICENAKSNLIKIAENLTYSKKMILQNNNIVDDNTPYSQPIVLQHFPTYRPSDASCIEKDSPNIELYRERWEVLSKNSTDWLGKILKPRLAFAGHSHHYCRSINRWNVEEYTVASFNWRNKVDPSFLMATFSASNYSVYKCNMLKQQSVLNVYGMMFITVIVITVGMLLKNITNKTNYYINLHKESKTQ